MAFIEDLGHAGEIVRRGDAGPAHWLALDSFDAFARADAVEALARIQANEMLARAFGDAETVARCRDLTVAVLNSAGHLEASAALAEELMAQYAAVGDEAGMLQALGQLITVRFARGDYERALDELTDGLVRLTRLRDATPAAATAFLIVANAASSAEMFELASAQLRRCQPLVRSLGDPFLARMLDSIAARNETRWAARLEMIGRPAEADARFREALRAAVRAQQGGPFGHWYRLGRLYEGFAWASLGEAELGRVALLETLGRDEAPLEPEDTLVLRLGLARACANLGRTGEAREHLGHTSGVRDTTFSHQWQVAIVLEAAEVERVDGGDHPGIALARHAAILLANSLWEERERRLESVMVRMQMLQLAEENERVGHAATQDPLTGIGNRRRLDAALEELTSAPTVPTCLLFIDLDRFKDVNDTFSHVVGDEVLKAIGLILQRESRDRDVIARYGGDEFVVMLRGAPLRTGAHVGERIRKAVASYPWKRIAPGLRVRVSIGVAEHRAGMTYDQLMAAADAAVYEAKQGGRDRVAVA